MIEATTGSRTILEEFEQALLRGRTFPELVRRQAGETRSLLERILTDTSFLSQVAAARRPYDFTYPKWATELAWVLWNPDGKVSSETRASVYDICASLLRETAEKPERRPVTRILNREANVWHLSELARRLSGTDIDLEARPNRPGK